MTCKYFLLFHRLSLHFVDCFLLWSFLVWCTPIDYFCFCCLCIWYHIKEMIPKANVKVFSPIFFFKKFSSSRSYVWVSNPLLFNFCEWCKTEVHFHFIACENLGFFFNLLKKLPFFFLLTILGLPCQILVDHICMGLFLGSWFYSIGLYTCFYYSAIF